MKWKITCKPRAKLKWQTQYISYHLHSLPLLYSVLGYGKNLLETLHKVSVRYDEVE
jgi:hypothetical protein